MTSAFDATMATLKPAAGMRRGLSSMRMGSRPSAAQRWITPGVSSVEPPSAMRTSRGPV